MADRMAHTNLWPLILQNLAASIGENFQNLPKAVASKISEAENDFHCKSPCQNGDQAVFLLETFH